MVSRNEHKRCQEPLILLPGPAAGAQRAGEAEAGDGFFQPVAVAERTATLH